MPLHSAVLLEVWQERAEGRKHWIHYKMMSADRQTVYSDGATLLIEMKSKLWKPKTEAEILESWLSLNLDKVWFS